MHQSALDIRYEGSKFYPSKLKQKLNLPIEILAQYGEISSSGRYKGQPSPYGMGLLEVSSNEMDINDLLREYSGKLTEWKSDLQECGVDEIVLDIEDSNDFPFEISLSPDLMHNLTFMNVSIEIHSTGKEEQIEDRNAKIKKILSTLKKEDLTNTITKHLQNLHYKMSDDALSILVYFLTTKNNSGNIGESMRQIEGLTKTMLALNSDNFKE